MTLVLKNVHLFQGKVYSFAELSKESFWQFLWIMLKKKRRINSI